MSALLQEASAEASNELQPRDERSLLEKFASRQSNEIVVAFAGPIGCGITSAVNTIEDSLRAFGYRDVVRIKLSTFLEESIKNERIQEPEVEAGASDRFRRYRRLQQVGMDIRRLTNNQAVLAEYAINQIVLDRAKREGVARGNQAAATVPARVAYLIDQVKRPEEVKLLRALYRNLFYLVGVTKSFDQRTQFLIDEGVKTTEIERLVEIDRNENSENGQRLDKTLHLADFFLRNDVGSDQKKHIDRFVHLIHGDASLTPTADEQGMYAAYAAGMRSACLSRQVGAAISSADGEIISTGCNDVPRAGGGLYSANSPHDARCVHLNERVCFNDHHKRELQTQIAAEIDRALGQQIEGEPGIALSASRRALVSESLYKNTRLKDLIEFSRSVHAEMDAIVSLARSGGGGGLRNATLYTTTFPCHSCARHIVAAGILNVIYIEPYEKSMAKDLHKDAISFEFSAAEDKDDSRVKFQHFQGISPRQFAHVFRADGRKDGDGKFISIDIAEAPRKIPEYLDNYFDFEAKAVENFQHAIEKLPISKSVDTKN